MGEGMPDRGGRLDRNEVSKMTELSERPLPGVAALQSALERIERPVNSEMTAQLKERIARLERVNRKCFELIWD